MTQELLIVPPYFLADTAVPLTKQQQDYNVLKNSSVTAEVVSALTDVELFSIMSDYNTPNISVSIYFTLQNTKQSSKESVANYFIAHRPTLTGD
jgi:hypothetical protein